MPSGKKRKRHKMATHKRKKRLRKNRHKKKQALLFSNLFFPAFKASKSSFVFYPYSTICGAGDLPVTV